MRSQLGLFTANERGIDGAFAKAERVQLSDDAWYEYVPAWLSGHEDLLQELAGCVIWHQEERTMYERVVAVPRLYATLPQDGPIPALLAKRGPPWTAATASASNA